GSREALAAFDLDQADAAGTEGLQRVGGTELRDIARQERGGSHDRRGRRHGDWYAINLQRDVERHVGTIRRRRSKIVIALRVHQRKSSGKYLSALRTGNGVKPPRPHSDPLAMVSQSSSSRASSPLPAPRFANIRSTSSTPRVDPTRHGVHFPQDSMAQNSSAKRAMRAMSTVSSKTTTP